MTWSRAAFEKAFGKGRHKSCWYVSIQADGVKIAVEGVYRHGCWCPACMWFYGEEEKLSQLTDLLEHFYEPKVADPQQGQDQEKHPPPGRVMSTRQKRQEERRKRKETAFDIEVDFDELDKDLEHGC